LLRRLQRTARPDLKLVAMSATLDAAPVAGYLGARALRSEGRRFEVAVEHLSPEEAARAKAPRKAPTESDQPTQRRAAGA